MLVAALPPNTFVLLPDRASGIFGEIARLVADNARTGTVHPVSVQLSGRLRAEDHFHFNDNGYAQVASDFVTAVLTRQPSTAGAPDELPVHHSPGPD